MEPAATPSDEKTLLPVRAQRYDIAQPTNLKEDLGKAWKFFSIGYDF